MMYSTNMEDESIPTESGIETIREYLEAIERIDVLGDNSGGFEVKYASEKKKLLKELVENNLIKFDNPARIEAGHPYILILPE